MKSKIRFKRVRSDYPRGVIGIYDNQGKTADRYTVVYEPFQGSDGRFYFPYLGMSESPFHPQGVGMHGELDHRYTRQNGERVINFHDLPKYCQKAVLQDLKP